MGNELINVLIVDDEKIVREGLRMLIDWEQYGFCICGESETGTDALDKISLYNPGLVLLDIRMPEMDGTQLIEHARNAGFKGYHNP
jgi:two-component system response regulator YesN